MKQEKKLRSLATRYRIDHGKKFRLGDVDPGDTAGLPKEFKAESLSCCSTQPGNWRSCRTSSTPRIGGRCC